MDAINRREAIKRTSAIMGGALTSSVVMGVLQGCQTDQSLDWIPKVLTPDQVYLVEQLTERILPATSTPGAKDARVVRFVDSMIEGYLSKDDKTRFLEGLTLIDQEAQIQYGKSFIKCSTVEQDALVGESAQVGRQLAKRQDGRENTEKSFFSLLKEMTLIGFFTSEVGATQVLNYDPVPGGYSGCAPLEEVGGKTWAT